MPGCLRQWFYLGQRFVKLVNEKQLPPACCSLNTIMKKIFFLFIASLFSLAIHAQQSWTVSHQKKVLLKNVEEDTEGNIIKIRRSALSLSGCLTITFKVNDGTVIRTLMADDSSRVGIKNWEKVKKTISISNTDLKKLFKGRNKILLYFTEIPKDPAKAAVVRMRPLHLCTLELK